MRPLGASAARRARAARRRRCGSRRPALRGRDLRGVRLGAARRRCDPRRRSSTRTAHGSQRRSTVMPAASWKAKRALDRHPATCFWVARSPGVFTVVAGLLGGDVRHPNEARGLARPPSAPDRPSRTNLHAALKTKRLPADHLTQAMDLNLLLQAAVEAGASDVHLKLGQPPVIRYDGDLTQLPDWAPLSEADLEEVLDAITMISPRRREYFDEMGDLDIAYSYPSLPRFRVNGFRQRGATSFAFRVIPSDIPSFSQLGLPERRRPTRRRASRARARHRSHGLGQDDHPRVDARPRQPHAPPAHRHHRGPDRDPAPRPRLHRQPARGRVWTPRASVRRCDASCVRTRT